VKGFSAFCRRGAGCRLAGDSQTAPRSECTENSGLRHATIANENHVFCCPGYTWVPSGGFRVVYEYANQLVSRGPMYFPPPSPAKNLFSCEARYSGTPPPCEIPTSWNYLQFQLSIGTRSNKRVSWCLLRLRRRYILIRCPSQLLATLNQFFNVQKPKEKNSI